MTPKIYRVRRSELRCASAECLDEESGRIGTQTAELRRVLDCLRGVGTRQASILAAEQELLDRQCQALQIIDSQIACQGLDAQEKLGPDAPAPKRGFHGQ